MKIIVITGSTRGIGYGLADSFLALGCAVVVSGRTQPAAGEAAARLAARHGADRVHGLACDVTDFAQVQALWDAARARFGRVDVWINNAGISHAQRKFWDHPPADIRAIVDTNVTGAMYGARVALRGMFEQGSGAFYNVEGLGSGGRQVAGLAIYGATKSALRYLTDALVLDTRGTPVIVGAIRPGMVVSGLLTPQRQEARPEDWERTRRIFNILADRVETVTPWLAAKILANDKPGARITWLTGAKAFRRFMLAPFQKRNVFDAPPRQ